MISYYQLGADKRLNEIVMAGSHDAGITSGASNVQTQDLDIRGQAEAGVRVFDLRIAAQTITGIGGKDAMLRSFHADGILKKDETKSRFVMDVGRQEDITRTKLRGGAFGLGLTRMLAEARGFVQAHPDEFLILKFDKCSNWALIAETCVNDLGAFIYKGTGNLNTKTLRDLRGKVIVLFTSDGIMAVRKQFPVNSGILGIRNLYAKDGGKTYFPAYDGLQYFGKGGTSVAKPFGKVGQNERKQAKLMKQGGGSNPDVMGMMYWTSTGILESIKDRNDLMWSGSNVAALKRMWKKGLSDAIDARIANHVDPTAHAFGNVLKAFMPNIVMIDFADASKCKTIYELNHVAATALTDAARALDDEIQQLQANYAQLQQNVRHRGGRLA
ncbi:MAG: hypothetical protein HY019_00735 [Aquabacterium sp.]|uniref:hypothetical protein n=1 Tax=Aquabacterium sp. TaxID=1872578 RepID=UPI0025C5FD68|nr:hypothetical protein [Aquabacterium sp.]MBI3380505.1 hypothetical protein [Aquabacterium sp.]